ncbi:uncharacterized protein LOC111331492 [Stylophora pistillata]|uniref:uncharacterized protein LOC111331492 n=1 Tax=Stylophora pistillata TaxID=50429 RepID=UPI000C051B27|nr:uncharacterized protein LOC111331492 [Stylophora pistillata]
MKIRALEDNTKNLTTEADKIRILEENITILQRKLAEKSMEINSNRLSLGDVIGVCAKILNSSNSCKNGGTCYPENERCRCKCVCPPGFVGKECEKAAESCMEIINDRRDKNIGPISSRAYPLHLGSDTLPVYCHMTSLGACRDGG